MTRCTAAVRRPDLRQCKRAAVDGCEFCAEHRELHARWEVFAWKALCWLDVPKWLFFLRWFV